MKNAKRLKINKEMKGKTYSNNIAEWADTPKALYGVFDVEGDGDLFQVGPLYDTYDDAIEKAKGSARIVSLVYKNGTILDIRR